MRLLTSLAVTLASIPALALSQSAPPVTEQSANMLERYTRAEQMLPWNTGRIAFGGVVAPQWYKDGSRFWFRNTTKSGADFLTVDPTLNVVRPLFDNARLAAAITMAADTSYDPNKLPFQTFRFAKDNEDERSIEFRAGRKRLICDIVAYSCAASDTLPSEVPYVLSPDRNWEAYVSRYNVWVRKRGGGDSAQLTTDGVEFWSYGFGNPSPQQLLAPRLAPRRPAIRWHQIRVTSSCRVRMSVAYCTCRTSAIRRNARAPSRNRMHCPAIRSSPFPARIFLIVWTRAM